VWRKKMGEMGACIFGGGGVWRKEKGKAMGIYRPGGAW
jgi:hypothetical protein